MTYHGSDVNNNKILPISKFVAKSANHVILVSEKMTKRLSIMGKISIVPCGIDVTTFKKQDRISARKYLNLNLQSRYILFSSGFDNYVKNYTLAYKIISSLDENIILLELNNWDRKLIPIIFNAVDLLLLTSHSEGSPQVIKEAYNCNCPIVTKNVGDVEEIITNRENNFIFDFKCTRSNFYFFSLFNNNPSDFKKN